jgi:hypothetical protein
VCFVDQLDAGLAITSTICTDLLGSGAVADDKMDAPGCHRIYA